jgi:hypothetical protein
MGRKRIGELLLEQRIITQAQLEAGLAAQKRTRQRLGATLVQQGLISEGQLASALAASLGLPVVDLLTVHVEWSAVHMLRARFCENHELFPFAVEGKTPLAKRISVAMSDPLNQPAIDEVEFTTGLVVVPRVATHSQVRAAILRYYHKVVSPGGLPGSPSVPSPIDEPDDEPVLIGEEIISRSNPMPPEPAGRSAPTAALSRAPASVSKDLEFLFGVKADEDGAVEKVERKLWALLRVLTRKGLMTREEFLAELKDD